MRFVIFAEDRPDGLELRLATRPTHLEYMSGFNTVVAGPILDDEGNPCGSMIVVELDSLAAARAFAENDPYNEAGLFERVSVREFKTVVWPTTDGA